MSKSTFGFIITKKRIYYAVGFVIFMIVFFSIRSKYFERSDFLRPVSRTIKNTAGRISKTWQHRDENIIENILDDKEERMQSMDTSESTTLQPWDKWMMENPHLQPVGDIFDKCGK